MTDKQVNPEIIFVSHASGLCGAERSLLDLVYGMKDAGFTPIVITPAIGPLTEELGRHDIEFHATQYHAWTGRQGHIFRALYRLMSNWLIALKYSSLFVKRDIQLVYVNTTVNPFGSMLAKFLKVPCLWHIREWVDNFDFGLGKTLAMIDKQSACVVTNSQAMQALLKPYFPLHKVKVVYNGPVYWKKPLLETPGEQAPSVGAEIKLCIVGTVCENKGQEDAIRVTARLNEQGVQASLKVIGEGDDAFVAALKKLAATLHVSDQVEWLGFVNEPLPLVQASDLCLICSRQEAFGRVAVEAMSVGTPVVCTQVGGLFEVMSFAGEASMYEPGDIQGFCEKIQALIEDKDRYQRIAAEGVEHVYQSYTVSEYQKHMLSIIQNLVKQA